MVSFVTAGVSAAHVAVLAVLVTGATGQHGGAEPGDRVVLRAHPGMMSGESILNKLNIKSFSDQVTKGGSRGEILFKSRNCFCLLFIVCHWRGGLKASLIDVYI